MKKSFMLLAAICFSAIAHAQVDIDMAKVFNVSETPIELNEAVAKVADGVVFIGDTRPADKIQDGKYKGMRAIKMRRSFAIDGTTRQFNNALAFRRAPHGSTKEHQVDVTMVPRSCMMQMKPTSGGTFQFEVNTSKEEAKLYVAVLNGTKWKNLATLSYKKEDKKGNKAEPLTPLTLEYKYQAGDEIWIYSNGSAYLLGMQFSGNLDTSFKGTDALAAYKAIRRANK